MPFIESHRSIKICLTSSAFMPIFSNSEPIRLSFPCMKLIKSSITRKIASRRSFKPIPFLLISPKAEATALSTEINLAPTALPANVSISPETSFRRFSVPPSLSATFSSASFALYNPAMITSNTFTIPLATVFVMPKELL